MATRKLPKEPDISQITTNSELFERFGAYSGYDKSLYDRYEVKRGLRNPDGSGVVAGITSISNVHGFLTDEGMQVPDQGRLTLRGYDINDIVSGVVADDRPGFEEVAFLLWAGDLPKQVQLDRFNRVLDSNRGLPRGFVNTLIMNYPSKNTMNMMARCILMLYAEDPYADDATPNAQHEIAVAIKMLAEMPRIAVLSWLACKCHLDPNQQLYINPPTRGLSTAETFLHMLRPNMEWTPEEAKMLDIMLMLHAEHGGGNNSSFTVRVLSSSGTDPYSAYAGGICSLKGPKHGGANLKVAAQQANLMGTVDDYTDEGQVADYLRRVLRREAFDNSGLVYGMGHAVYTLSDPRAELCKKYARELAEGTEYQPRFELIETIERLTPQLFEEERGAKKTICANIDMYSGLVYEMLGIPRELYTPLFACARIAGWAAHRFEEIVEGKRIIRPAYQSIYKQRPYVKMGHRCDQTELEERQDPPVHGDYLYD